MPVISAKRFSLVWHLRYECIGERLPASVRTTTCTAPASHGLEVLFHRVVDVLLQHIATVAESVTTSGPGGRWGTSAPEIIKGVRERSVHGGPLVVPQHDVGCSNIGWLAGVDACTQAACVPGRNLWFTPTSVIRTSSCTTTRLLSPSGRCARCTRACQTRFATLHKLLNRYLPSKFVESVSDLVLLHPDTSYSSVDLALTPAFLLQYTSYIVVLSRYG